MASNKKVLVIGGGFCGIGSIKCLKEDGYDPICYEKTSNAGGTWYYRDETPMGMPSIMPTTVINHSKEMGALTNFVPNKKFPNYMRHHELLEMFNDVGNQFDCFRHIVYNREVIRVKRSSNYDETGRWDVKVKNTETGEITEETFDAVFVCIGHITYPKIPDFPGMEKFQGVIMHTHSLKRVDGFRNKKVVVVGIGCSGLDAAVEISSVSSQVYLSSRNGAWIIPRVGPYGLPFDYAMLRRFANVIQNTFGYKWSSWYLEKNFINTKFNHNLYNLRPLYCAMARDPSTNDILPAKLISGSVVLRKNIKCFTEKGVIFENETQVTEADVVVMATGYSWKFPFLEDDVVTKEDGRINLYKCMYSPNLKHPTLPIVGFLLPFGPGFPLGEMQCRYAVQHLSGHLKLPRKEDMLEEIKARHEENSQRYAPSEKMTVRVDYINYMDELGSEMGVKPNMWKLLFTDYTLWRALFFGPALPYQYRLQGPHKWEGARKAILTAHERVRFPLSGEYKKSTKRNVSVGQYLKYIVTFLLLAYWLAQTQESSVKYYLVALLIPYFMTWNGFYKKYLFSLLMLPFFVTWQGFTSCYMLTLFAPLLLTAIASA